MRCKDESENSENPEECEYCGFSTHELTRYVDKAGGLTITWLCKYCELDRERGKNDTVNSIAAMLNRLEKSIKEMLNPTDDSPFKGMDDM